MKHFIVAALWVMALLLIVPCKAAAQKSVTEYTPAQRSALQAFISKNNTYSFIPETWFEEGSLSGARNDWGFGKNFKPYYQTGDFNRDGKLDFAVVLARGKNIEDENWGMGVIVFNQIAGKTYRVAHVEQEDFSERQFIKADKNVLHVGVLETDSLGCFVPAGNGYIVEPCN